MMKKKITSFMLAFALALTALPMVSPLTAKAAEGIEVYVTIANKGEVTVAQEKVTVVDRDKDGTYTVDEALYAAHEAYYPGGASVGYASGMTEYGLSLSKLWGDTSYNYGYNNNHASCWSAADPVKAGDYLVAFVYQKAWPDTMDSYACFAENSYDAKVDESVNVTLAVTGYDESWNVVQSNKSGATLKLYDGNGKAIVADQYDLTDNGDGTYAVKVKTAGTYKIVATENTTPIIPAVCRLTVGEKKQESIGNEPGGNTGGNHPDGTVNKKHKTIVKNTAKYLQSLKKVGYGSEWLVLGLTRAGYDCPEGYYDSVVSYVKENINEKEQLSGTKATENARVILALTAAGYDVTKVGGHNLLKGLTDMTYVKKQGVNGPIWTLLALDSKEYQIPTDKTAKEQVTRGKLVKAILDVQLEDGGFAFSGTTADPDMTAMALQALAPYYDAREDVKIAVDKALACLSQIQYDNGGFGTTSGNNAPSCAQVIVALTALGIDPHTDSRFVKNGRSVVDALSTFALADGGFSNFVGEERNALATEQGMYAMTAYLRFKDGQTALYDMTDVTEEEAENTYQAPQTGDMIGSTAMVWVWISLMGMVAILVMKRRREA